MRLPCQLVRTGRKLVFRLLSWNPYQRTFWRLVTALRVVDEPVTEVGIRTSPIRGGGERQRAEEWWDKRAKRGFIVLLMLGQTGDGAPSVTRLLNAQNVRNLRLFKG